MTPEATVIETLFRVVDKGGNDLDFKLNTAQRKVDEYWAKRMIIPKARQEGVSTYFLAKSTVKCLGKKNTRAVVISHDTESTERMLEKVRYFLGNLRGPAPVIKNNSKNELTFPKTNSMFYIGTAGSRAFGRGDTISDLHCSEVAFWPDPKKLMSGLLQAVPMTGCVSIESTGNGAGNWYHSACMRAARNQSTYKLLFLPWQEFAEYTLELTPEESEEVMAHLREDINEPELMAKYKLTPGQIAWRRFKLEDECDGDLYEWNKEYPSCLDDCFQIAQGGIFQIVRFIPTDDWVKVNQHLHIMRGHPDPRLHYIVGGDVGGGVGQDSSVAEVFCIETEEQVAEYINNRIDPDDFASELAALGYLFNEGYIGCESNNHGILTLKELTAHDYNTGRPRYPAHKVYRTPRANKGSRAEKDQVRKVIDLGVRTTVTSKPLIIGGLRKKLAKTATIHSQVLKNELSTFVEKDDGSMGASENCHDDTVMASAMAFFVMGKGALTLIDEPVRAEEIVTKPDPFSVEAMVLEMTGRKMGEDNSKARGSFFPSYLQLIQ